MNITVILYIKKHPMLVFRSQQTLVIKEAGIYTASAMCPKANCNIILRG